MRLISALLALFKQQPYEPCCPHYTKMEQVNRHALEHGRHQPYTGDPNCCGPRSLP